MADLAGLSESLLVLVIGDFRFPGGTSAATEHEIRAMHVAGHRVEVLQVDSHVFGPDRGIHPDLAALIERGIVRRAQPDEALEADVVIAHNPMVFEIAPLPRLNLRAGARMLVAHQPACDAAGRLYYDPWRVAERMESEFGAPFVWAPISPVCRASFARVGFGGPLLAEDWRNILFPEEWRSDRDQPLAEIPVMGRHGRPQLHKWPATRAEVLHVYPDDPRIRVRLLGVEDAFLRLMRHRLPPNWEVFPFGAVPAAEFLKTIDFFVYYHHPRWIEAFGRTVAEAAASGAVAILPPHFEPTFGESALYAPPGEAIGLVHALHADWPRYLEQSERGRRWIADQHGPERFLGLLARIAAEGPDLVVSSSAWQPSLLKGTRMRRRAVIMWRKSKVSAGHLVSGGRRLAPKALAKIGLLPIAKRMMGR